MSGTWIILGASSSLAKAFSRHAATYGSSLILAGRDMPEINTLAADLCLRGAPSVQTLPFDATDPQNLPALMDAAAAAQGPVSVYMAIGQMPEEGGMRIDPELCAQMIAANYTGAVLALNSLLPLFQAQQAGRIIIIGSVAGDRGRKKNYLYGSSKAGLHVYAEGLAAHLSAYNVPVLLVKPGVMDTAMTWGLQNPPLPLGLPPGLAAACWKKSVNGGVLYYPWFWKHIMLIIRHLPRAIFNRLNF